MRYPEDRKDYSSEGEVSIPYEKRSGAMWSWERVGYFDNALSKFKRRMAADFYAPPQRDAGYHFLNSASLPNPDPRARAVAREVHERWEAGTLSKQEKEKITIQARKEIAGLVNAPTPDSVVLCRNTSEAFSLFIWLSDVLKDLHSNNWHMVLSTDVENPSIERGIFIIRDHSNVDREDTLTTYPEFASQRPRHYQPIQARATGLRWGLFRVARRSDEQAFENMKDCLKDFDNVAVLIISQVSRETGRQLPVAKMIAAARAINPNLFIVVDGAQAVGNIPVDMTTLNCDMYIGCGHKALQGEAVGFAVLNLNSPRIQEGLKHIRSVKSTDQVILRGMFHPSLNVKPNVDDDISYPELAGFIESIQILRGEGWISGNDVSQLDQHRARLRDYCLKGLQQIKRDARADIQILNLGKSTNFILAFRVGPDPFIKQGGMQGPEGVYEPGAMHDEDVPTESEGKRIAQQLYERGVGIAFLRRGNIFRVSFSKETTQSDIDAFLAALKDSLRQTS